MNQERSDNVKSVIRTMMLMIALVAMLGTAARHDGTQPMPPPVIPPACL
jgi:hypothetical protein